MSTFAKYIASIAFAILLSAMGWMVFIKACSSSSPGFLPTVASAKTKLLAATPEFDEIVAFFAAHPEVSYIRSGSIVGLKSASGIAVECFVSDLQLGLCTIDSVTLRAFESDTEAGRSLVRVSTLLSRIGAYWAKRTAVLGTPADQIAIMMGSTAWAFTSGATVWIVHRPAYPSPPGGRRSTGRLTYDNWREPPAGPRIVWEPIIEDWYVVVVWQ